MPPFRGIPPAVKTRARCGRLVGSVPVAASRRGELLHDPGAERRQVVRPAAGGDVLVGDHLLVDNIAAGVADVRPDAWVGGQGAAPDDVGLDERPRAVADHADRLTAINNVADKADGRLVLAQIIGVDRSARQDEGVVVASRCLADQPVYGEGDGRVNEVFSATVTRAFAA